jgi:uncharacterized damage-inducible protein DinB
MFLRELYSHMEWADARVWMAVLASETASSDELLLDTLFHLHLAQHAFLEIWKGDRVTLRERSDFDSAIEIQRWARQYHEAASPFLDSCSPSRLEEEVRIPWARRFAETLGREPAPVTMAETVYQVAAHSVHHRGQVNRRLREVGADPPLVDYLAWLWMGRPAAEWPT